MDRRAFKNFITKRSSMWTLSLCMTGAIVLGGIAAVDNARRDDELQAESEMGDTVYLGQENDEDLFYTLDEEDLEGDMLDGGVAANADGSATNADGSTADGSTAGDSLAANADRSTADGSTASDGLAVNADRNAADGSLAANTDGSAVDGSLAANADGSTAVNADGTAEEASSSGIISEQALLEAGVSFGEEASLMWPSAGTILIDYSMDSSVYFPTLNQYKYNPALIIGSEVGNQVLASAKGIVESVTIDEETGTTLVLNIGNGYRLTYGQIKELTAEPGDVVEAGAVLGYVSEPTKYYSTEGGNLYFKMTQEETPVDPVLYLE